MWEEIRQHEWVVRFDVIGSDVAEVCDVCDRKKEQGHQEDCWIGCMLSTDLAVQARHLLDVVARAREVRGRLGGYEYTRKGYIPQALYDAYFNLVGALAVLDDKSKKEKPDG